jgi:hypothetical protein
MWPICNGWLAAPLGRHCGDDGGATPETRESRPLWPLFYGLLLTARPEMMIVPLPPQMRHFLIVKSLSGPAGGLPEHEKQERNPVHGRSHAAL